VGKKTKGKSTQYNKSGGYNSANKDFDSLGLSNVKKIEGGRVGKLKDGRTVVVRKKSSEGHPTLEIQDGKRRIKIRYYD